MLVVLLLQVLVCGSTLNPTVVPSSAPVAAPTTFRIITSIGTGIYGNSGDGGTGGNAQVSRPNGVWVSATGVVYIDDRDYHVIRRVTTSDIITTVVGTGAASSTGDGGQATAATINSPGCVWGDSMGTLYVSEVAGYRVRSISLSSGIITLFAGNGVFGASSDGVKATSSALGEIYGIFGDTAGRLYLCDTSGHTVLRVSTSTAFITLQCGIPGNNNYNGNGLVATSTALSTPIGGIVVNNQYLISEYYGYRIRLISSNFIVSTVAGSGNSGSSGGGGAATAAFLNSPNGVIVDSQNNVFFSTTLSHFVYQVATTNIIYVVAGTGDVSSSGDGAPATSAGLLYPKGIYQDTQGSIHITEDTNVRKLININPTVAPTTVPTTSKPTTPTLTPTITPTFTTTVAPPISYLISAFAGIGYSGSDGDGGQATAASLDTPVGVWMDSTGVLYIVDTKVRSVSASGIITTIAGKNGGASSGDGGPATSAEMYNAVNIWGNSQGVLYITEFSGRRVRAISASTNIITTFAGTGGSGSSGNDGPATSALFNSIFGVSGNTAGKVYVVDNVINVIRVINAGGIISLYAGSTSTSYNGENIPLTSVNLKGPKGIFVDTNSQNMYVSDFVGHRVRLLTFVSGVATTVIGMAGVVGFSGDGGPATAAKLNSPYGLTTDTLGGLYVVSTADYRIRQVVNGIIYTIAGTGVALENTGDDGPAINAKLNYPSCLCLDSSGSVYLSMTPVIRKLSNINPTVAPTAIPSVSFTPSVVPSRLPSLTPSVLPTVVPSALPSVLPTTVPPSVLPTILPTVLPTLSPSVLPSHGPTRLPTTMNPSLVPTLTPTLTPTVTPTLVPIVPPTVSPSILPSILPTVLPSVAPTLVPSIAPSRTPTIGPTVAPSILPTISPSVLPTLVPTLTPTASPTTMMPTLLPTVVPSMLPSQKPSLTPTATPTVVPSYSFIPSAMPSSNPTTFTITAFAGLGTAGFTGNDGAATSAQVSSPLGIWANSAGVLYIADTYVRTVSSAGIISLFAGLGSTFSFGDGGAATAAAINSPSCVWGNTMGVVYICEPAGSKIRAVSQANIITTFAGVGSSGTSGDNGPATSASFGYLFSIWGDAIGNVYFVDYTNSVVRVISNVGTITTYAGTSSTSYNGENIKATNANLSGPKSMCLDTMGTIYISEYVGSRVRLIFGGIASTLAGTGTGGYAGDGGSATNAQINTPWGMGADTKGSLFFATYNDGRVRQVLSNTIYTVAGQGGFLANTGDNGPAISAALNSPTDAFADSLGNVYVAMNAMVRKMVNTSPTAMPSTSVPTTPPSLLPTVGPTLAPSCKPTIVPTVTPTLIPSLTPTVGPTVTPTILPSVPPTRNPTMIPTVNPSLSPSALPSIGPSAGPSVIPTITPTVYPSYSYTPTLMPSVSPPTSFLLVAYAGTGLSGNTGDGLQATMAQLVNPQGVWMDSVGVLYIADAFVRSVSATGIMSTFASLSSATSGGDGGFATAASIKTPTCVWGNTLGVVYICEQAGYRIRSVSQANIITTYAGIGTSGNAGNDGPATSASFGSCYGAWGDSIGNLYIADTSNVRVRAVSSTGTMTLFAGNGQSYNGENNPATGAAIFPKVISVDSLGNVYISEYNYYRVRKISGGFVNTVAGSGNSGFTGDGGSATSAKIGAPWGLSLTKGSLYFATHTDYRVRLVQSSIIYTVAGSGIGDDSGENGPAINAGLNSPTGASVDSVGNIFVAMSASGIVRKLIDITPTVLPTVSPSVAPSRNPTVVPTVNPTLTPTIVPSVHPSVGPSVIPSFAPTLVPSVVPTLVPTTTTPTVTPSLTPSLLPSVVPSPIPTVTPTVLPSYSFVPTVTPSYNPTAFFIVGYVGTGTAGSSGDGGQATSAQVSSPNGVWVNTAGVLYIADIYVRSVSTAGIISTFASLNSGSSSGDGGFATAAAIMNPACIWGNSVGVIYICEQGGYKIRAVSTSNIISTYAGKGSTGNSGDGVPATSAFFGNVYGAWGDSTGNLYIADLTWGRVRLVSTAGTLTNVAGNSISTYNGENVPATGASIFPKSLCLDTLGTLYISEYSGNRVRFISGGLVTTVAGTGTSGYSGDGGPATSGDLTSPWGLSPDGKGSLYVATYGGRIRQLQSNKIYTVAGFGTSNNNGDNGPAISAGLNAPTDAFVDAKGNIFVSMNSMVRKMIDITPTVAPTVSPTNKPSVANPTSFLIDRFAGNGFVGTTGDGGSATSAQVSNPQDIWINSLGSMFVADTTVRSVSSSQIITTFASVATALTAGDGGAATSAYINVPQCVWGSTAGVIYICEKSSYRVRVVSTSGIISTYAGVGIVGSSGTSPASSANIGMIFSVWGDASGNVLMADALFDVIRIVSPSGIMTRYAGGTGNAVYNGENLAGTATNLWGVQSLFIDSSSNLFISEYNGCRVRLMANGIVSTLVGTGVNSFGGDGGRPTSAQLNTPWGVATDTLGVLYIDSYVDGRIRQVASNTIYTVAGQGTGANSGDGGLALNAALNSPADVIVDSAGIVYVACYAIIRKMVNNNPTLAPSAVPSVVPTTSSPSKIPTCVPSSSPSFTLTASPSVSYSPTGVPSNANPTAFIISAYGGNNVPGATGDGGAATAASLAVPHGVWMDSMGVLYIADTTVRAISATGIITTFASVGATGSTGDGGPATSATINRPNCIWGNSAGAIFICENLGYKIRTVSTSNIITTYAGLGSSSPGVAGNGGQATAAVIGSPYGIWGLPNGAVFFTDYSYNLIRGILASGIIYISVGTGTATYNGDGPSTSVNLNAPIGIFLDDGGNIYVTESGARVRFVFSSSVYTLAGQSSTGYCGDGGAATAACLSSPWGLAVETTGVVYVASNADCRVRQVSNGIIYTVAGVGPASYNSGDNGPALNAVLNGPTGLYEDSGGKIYVAVTAMIRKLSNLNPTVMPTLAPSALPSVGPTLLPTVKPTVSPSALPSVLPTIVPTQLPTIVPTLCPSVMPTLVPSVSLVPTGVPSISNPTSFLINGYVGTGITGNSGNGGFATAAKMNSANGVWLNTAGVLYVAESTVRSVSAAGIINAFASVSSTFSSGDGGPATSSTINGPYCVWGNSVGVVYICDGLSFRIRVVTSSGIINTYAGIGTTSPSTSNNGNGGPATSAVIGTTYGIWGTTNGAIYLTDYSYGVVRVISPTGTITNFAGTPGSTTFNVESGPLTSVNLNAPQGIFIDTQFTGYVSESGKRVRSFSNSIIATIIGSSVSSFCGDGGAPTSACLGTPWGITMDTVGSIYVATTGDGRVRQVSSGVIYTVAGQGSSTVNLGDGGPALVASIHGPTGLYADSTSRIFIGVYAMVRTLINNNPTAMPTCVPTLLPTVNPSVQPSLTPSQAPTQIPTMSPSVAPPTVYSIIMYAGSASAAGNSGDGGAASSALLTNPYGIWQDTLSFLYITDYGAQFVRKVNALGIITTFAGNGGTINGNNGPATSAAINVPTCVWGNTLGVVFIGDQGGNVRSVSSGIITQYAGDGFTGSTGDGFAATAARFNQVYSLYGDTVGVLFIADQFNFKVRKVSAAGIITTYAGSGLSFYNGESLPATSTNFYDPWGLAVFNDQVMYISECDGNRIRSLSMSTNIVTTFAGTGATGFSGDSGQASAAILYAPFGMFVDSQGVMYFANNGNCRVRQISASGIIYTIAGSGAIATNGDGGPALNAAVSYPRGVWKNSVGSVFVSQTASVRRMYSINPTVAPTLQPSSLHYFSYNGYIASADVLIYDGAGTTLDDFMVIAATGGSNNMDISSYSPVCLDTNTVQTSTSRVYIFSRTEAGYFKMVKVQITLSSNKIYWKALAERYYDSGSLLSLCSVVVGTAWPQGTESTLATCFACNGYGVSSITFSVANAPTSQPSTQPSSHPSGQPSRQPTSQPSVQPTSQPSRQPTSRPSIQPSSQPVGKPSVQPSTQPSSRPTCQPSSQPTIQPGSRPTSQPSRQPTTQPFSRPSSQPSEQPTDQPSTQPLVQPASHPTSQPSVQPVNRPSGQPSRQPSSQPSGRPTLQPTVQPSMLSRHYFTFSNSITASDVMIYSGASSLNDFSPISALSLGSSINGGIPLSFGIFCQDSSSSQTSTSRVYLFSILELGALKMVRVQFTLTSNSIYWRATDERYALTGLTLTCSNVNTVFPTATVLFLSTCSTCNGYGVSSFTFNIANAPTSQPSMQPSSQPSHPSSQPTRQPTSQPTRQPTRQPSLQPIGGPSSQPSAQPSMLTRRTISDYVTATDVLIYSGATGLNDFTPISALTGGASINTGVPMSFSLICQDTTSSQTPTSQVYLFSVQQGYFKMVKVQFTVISNSIYWRALDERYYQLGMANTCTNVVNIGFPSGSANVLGTCSTCSGYGISSFTFSVLPAPTSQPSTQPSSQPTSQPTVQPSRQPSSLPSAHPSAQPARQPSSQPSQQPSAVPTTPTLVPTFTQTTKPSVLPSLTPSLSPSVTPTAAPSALPSLGPSVSPSLNPTVIPSVAPTHSPTITPSINPSVTPSVLSTLQPTISPTTGPTVIPSVVPSCSPSAVPTAQPSCLPTILPSMVPNTVTTSAPTSTAPTVVPTTTGPTPLPTVLPSAVPNVVAPASVAPSVVPTAVSPTVLPTIVPTTVVPNSMTGVPSGLVPTVITTVPTVVPTVTPNAVTTAIPTAVLPSVLPSLVPTLLSTALPNTVSVVPSVVPTVVPTAIPSVLPPGASVVPSCHPSLSPLAGTSIPIATIVPTTVVDQTAIPTRTPSVVPSASSVAPAVVVSTGMPSLDTSLPPTTFSVGASSVVPTLVPSNVPSLFTSVPLLSVSQIPTAPMSSVPTLQPSGSSSLEPSSDGNPSQSLIPILSPSLSSSQMPALSQTPTVSPSTAQSAQPSESLSPALFPTMGPSVSPSLLTLEPTLAPATASPSTIMTIPSCNPTVAPSVLPTAVPSILPTTSVPSVSPTDSPTIEPTVVPSVLPSVIPSLKPSRSPSVSPSIRPTLNPTVRPSVIPTVTPSVLPTVLPSIGPSVLPSVIATLSPTLKPSVTPTVVPTVISNVPQFTSSPTAPTVLPSIEPSAVPSRTPSLIPSVKPTDRPVVDPTFKPTRGPTLKPSVKPTRDPTLAPTRKPTNVPSIKPSAIPSVKPTIRPTLIPTTPTVAPSQPRPSISPSPTFDPTISIKPSVVPSLAPSHFPTKLPSGLPTSAFPSVTPSAAPTVAPTTATPSVVPTTQVPSAVPSTLEFYRSHPKATLPSNQSISVVGLSDVTSFKIVLPFLSISNGNQGVAFSNIFLVQGTMGSSFVINGGLSMAATIDVSAATASFSNVVSTDSAKRAVSVVQDFNGDGYKDLIIGDPFTSRCYVLYGNQLGLTNMTKGFTIFGQDGDLTGWSVSGAGDFNNDTMQDIVIGAPNAKGVGAAYVIYGKRSMVDVYLNNLTTTDGFVVFGALKSDRVGISVSNAGDVNKDGCDDIVVGSVGTAAYFAGAAFVLYGGRNVEWILTTSVLPLSQGYKLSGVSYQYAGYSVSAAGDVNKDGYDDVVIGSCPQRNTLTLSAYLIFGAPAASVASNVQLASLTSSQGVRITGAGVIVSAAGDVNHDTFKDVLVTTNVESNDLGGWIVLTNVNDLQASSRSPTLLPSEPSLARTALPSSPTVRPSVMATLTPTLKPVVVPSLSPVGPTAAPINGTSEPTIAPSAEPSSPSSHPTSIPTLLTEEPSQEPSEPPTIPPTLEPSDAPSLHPTIEPSESPTEIPTVSPSVEPTSGVPSFSPLTRNPLSIPTLLPSIASTLPLLQEFVIQGGDTVYNNSDSFANYRYVVNATGQVGIVSSRGANTYYIVPQTNLTLTIWTFNQSSDVIDLTLFTAIHKFSDLTITAGSINIRLSSNDLIHILNLEPGDVNEKNFVFSPSAPGKKSALDRAIEIIKVAVPIGGLLIAAFFAYRMFYWSARKAAAEVLPRKLVMVFASTNQGDYVFEEDEEQQQQQSHDDDIESNVRSRMESADSPSHWSISDLEKIEEGESEEEEMSSGVESVEVSEETEVDFEVPVDFNVDLSHDDDNEDELLSAHTLDSNGDWIVRPGNGVNRRVSPLNEPADLSDSDGSSQLLSDFSLNSEGEFVDKL